MPFGISTTWANRVIKMRHIPTAVVWALFLLAGLGLSSAVYDQYAITATDESSGIQITWTTYSGTTKFLNLPGHHFPDTDLYKLLNILQIVDSDQLYIFLSVENAVLRIIFEPSNGELNFVSYNVITWPEGGSLYCQPTTLFSTKYSPIVACLNHTDDSLWFISVESQFTLGGDDTTIIPESLSKFVRTDTGCPGLTSQKNNILFTFNDTVCAYNSDGEPPETTCAKILSKNCSYVLDLKAIDREKVNVYCMGNIVEAVDVCDFKPVATYSLSSTGIPIPCSQDLTVYINESGVYVPAGAPGDRPTSGLWKDGDYGTFENGNCVKTEGGTFLILVFENSTVIVMDIFKQSVYTLTNTSCTIDGRCLYPQVCEERFISYTNGTHSLVKDLNSFNINAESTLLAVDTVADVILVFTGPNPPPLQKLSSTPTGQTQPSPTTFMPSSGAKSNEPLVIIGSSVAVIIVAVVFILFAAAVIYVACRRRKRGQLSNQHSLLPAQEEGAGRPSTDINGTEPIHVEPVQEERTGEASAMPYPTNVVPGVGSPLSYQVIHPQESGPPSEDRQNDLTFKSTQHF